jgi:hypothetical protein
MHFLSMPDFLPSEGRVRRLPDEEKRIIVLGMYFVGIDTFDDEVARGAVGSAPVRDSARLFMLQDREKKAVYSINDDNPESDVAPQHFQMAWNTSRALRSRRAEILNRTVAVRAPNLSAKPKAGRGRHPAHGPRTDTYTQSVDSRAVLTWRLLRATTLRTTLGRHALS